MLLGLTLFWPIASSAQVFLSDEKMGIISGIVLSAAGSAVCLGVNGYKLAQGSPSTTSGIFGVVFGVSTIAFLAVAKAQEDMDVTNAGILTFGSVALVSTVLGGWSLLKARSSSTVPQVQELNARPFMSFKTGSKDCVIGISLMY
jgi:multidrug transporter EmrE-like cation transporter